MSQSNNRHVGGSSGGLFQPDLFLADQLTVVRGMAAWEGERQLMVAVLEDAALCFKKYMFARDRRGRNLFEEAEEWIMEEDTGAAFAFRQVCEVLGLDVEYIREGLRKWQARQMLRVDVERHEPGLAAADREISSGRWSADLVDPLRKASGE